MNTITFFNNKGFRLYTNVNYFLKKKDKKVNNNL